VRPAVSFGGCGGDGALERVVTVEQSLIKIKLWVPERPEGEGCGIPHLPKAGRYGAPRRSVRG